MFFIAHKYLKRRIREGGKSNQTKRNFREIKAFGFLKNVLLLKKFSVKKFSFSENCFTPIRILPLELLAFIRLLILIIELQIPIKIVFFMSFQKCFRWKSIKRHSALIPKRHFLHLTDLPNKDFCRDANKIFVR